MPTLLVRSGRNPTEMCVAIGMLVLLAYSLFDGAPSNVVAEALPNVPAKVLWGSLCGLGALITLAGLWIERDSADPPRAVVGLGVERAGQLALGLGIGLYVVLLWDGSDFDRAGIPITMGTALALGALGRCGQITRGLRRIERRR